VREDIAVTTRAVNKVERNTSKLNFVRRLEMRGGNRNKAMVKLILAYAAEDAREIYLTLTGKRAPTACFGRTLPIYKYRMPISANWHRSGSSTLDLSFFFAAMDGVLLADGVVLYP